MSASPTGLSGSFWLGGSDAAFEGDWHWMDGSRIIKGTPFWAIHNGVLGKADYMTPAEWFRGLRSYESHPFEYNFGV